jgi:hypothetical protein
MTCRHRKRNALLRYCEQQPLYPAFDTGMKSTETMFLNPIGGKTMTRIALT